MFREKPSKLFVTRPGNHCGCLFLLLLLTTNESSNADFNLLSFSSFKVILQTGTQLIDIFSGGKLSQVNRATGMDTVGLLQQIGIMNPFTRKQETEADYLGLIFSSLSGYDIRETTKFWERMKEKNKGKEPPVFMNTHPSSQKRIENLDGWMNEIILDYPPIKT